MEGGQRSIPISQFPLISIITPSYNQGRFIEETIRSVIEQDYPNIEHIVIDGGSTDETVEVLRRFDGRIRWVSEPDEGQADAINKGLRIASGDILAYLNSDDTYLPGAFAVVAAQFAAHPDAGLIFGDCQAVTEQGEVYGLIKGHPFDVQRMIMRGEFVPQQAAFWSRIAMDAVGMFDTNLHFCMDHDYFIRIGQRFTGMYVAQPLANFRFHGSSKTMSLQEKHWSESMSVSQRHGMSRRTTWYWIRTLRHHGLRLLPDSLEHFVRRVLNRPYDPAIAQQRIHT
jgi:glycosyltransferase involved in cell wall biosynthesis